MKTFIRFQHLLLLLLLFLFLFDCEAKILPESPVRLSAQVKSNKFPFGYNNILSHPGQEMKKYKLIYFKSDGQFLFSFIELGIETKTHYLLFLCFI